LITTGDQDTTLQLRRFVLQPGVQLWGYLLLVTLAELVTALVSAQFGQLMHMVLLGVLVLHTALDPDNSIRRFLLALMLAPLIRVLSLSLPLTRFPQLAWYPIVAVPLLLAAWVIVRQLGLSRRELGLRVGNLPLQLGIASLGIVLGIAEHYILAPRPQFEEPNLLAIALASLNLLLATGFSEELIFRGILQAEGRRVLGRWALLYVSILFGVLHIGYLSLLDVLFVTGVGLLFAYLVLWTGSILGVTLAHGITNSMLFLVMPFVVQDSTALHSTPWAPWAFAACVLISLGAVAMVVRTQLELSRADSRSQIGLEVRLLRRAAGMNHEELSKRTGLSSHNLAALEVGLYQLQLEERERLADVLGVAPEALAPREV
jgi:membrane protease YdiL (CAAX protease family)/DNA-binding XRE family transcriptional regulator